MFDLDPSLSSTTTFTHTTPITSTVPSSQDIMAWTDHYSTLSFKPQSPLAFVPTNCTNASFIGSSCNVSAEPCDIARPCQNAATCVNDPLQLHRYHCACSTHSTGKHCELPIGPCKPNTCLHGGKFSVIPRMQNDSALHPKASAFP